MLKRTLSLLLMTLIVTMYVPSIVHAETFTEMQDELISLDDSQQLPDFIVGNDLYSRESYTIDTEFDGIKKSPNGYYAMSVQTKSGLESVPAGKMDINLANTGDIKKFQKDPRITQEMKNRILLLSEQVIKNGDSLVVATIFSTELLPPLATESNTNLLTAANSTTTTSYCTYNGALMRSDIVVYTGLGTQTFSIVRGTGTKDITKTIVDTSVTLVGATTKLASVAFFANGYSLLSSFISLYGSSYVTGSTSDFAEAHVTYNCSDQWTYRQVGNEWYLGLCSQKAVITKMYQRQYYYNSTTRTGKEYVTDRSVSVTIKSPHFDSPWATAYQYCMSPQIEWMSYKVGGITLYF